jgi:hypothetical protein
MAIELSYLSTYTDALILAIVTFEAIKVLR